MKKLLIIMSIIAMLATLAGCGSMVKKSGSDQSEDKDTDKTTEMTTEEKTEATTAATDDAEATSLEEFGFTATFDPAITPEDKVTNYKTTDTINYVVIGTNFPTGSTIHQVWTFLGDDSTVEGDLVLDQEAKFNYLNFNLTPNGAFPAGAYKVELTWTVNGVDGVLESSTIEVVE